jgi:hypothetical protein
MNVSRRKLYECDCFVQMYEENNTKDDINSVTVLITGRHGVMGSNTASYSGCPKIKSRPGDGRY